MTDQQARQPRKPSGLVGVRACDHFVDYNKKAKPMKRSSKTGVTVKDQPADRDWIATLCDWERSGDGYFMINRPDRRILVDATGSTIVVGARNRRGNRRLLVYAMLDHPTRAQFVAALGLCGVVVEEPQEKGAK